MNKNTGKYRTTNEIQESNEQLQKYRNLQDLQDRWDHCCAARWILGKIQERIPGHQASNWERQTAVSKHNEIQNSAVLSELAELFNCNNFNMRLLAPDLPSNGSSLKDLKCTHSNYGDSNESRIVIFRHYLPVLGVGNLRACCLPWMW